MTTWTYGSTNLSTIGNITMLDDSIDLPDRRGSNITIPFRHGTIHVPKFYGERTLTFGIFINKSTAALLETAMEAVFSLFSTEQRTMTVVREDASTRTALMSVNKRIQTKRLSNGQAKVVVEFVMADPFFRGSALIADNTTTINASPKNLSVANTGTVQERNPTILLTGPIGTTYTTITSPDGNKYLTYGAAIAGGATVTIGTDATGEYYATHSGSGNVIGNVTHAGDTALLAVDSGTQVFVVTSDLAVSGTAKISFYPPFI